jgi:protein SCO1/2
VKKALLIGGILFVPAIIVLFLLNFGKNQYKKLPIYGSKTPLAISGGNQVDTIYHQVSTFFHSYDNHFAADSLENRIWMVSFINPNCGEAGGFAYSQLLRLQESLENSKSIKFVNFYAEESSSKDVVDSIYNRYHWDRSRMYYVGIPTDSISSLVSREYLISNFQPEGKEWQIVLIDHQKRIRSYFNLTQKRDIDDLMGALTVLTKEKNLEDVATNK